MSKPEQFDDLQAIANAAGLRLSYDDSDHPAMTYVYRRGERTDAIFEASAPDAIHAFLMGWIACSASR